MLNWCVGSCSHRANSHKNLPTWLHWLYVLTEACPDAGRPDQQPEEWQDTSHGGGCRSVSHTGVK